ncbi:hypothetical protein [Prosthecobacter sp.]|uniref:hypothetical protein n=1 Tax=Prosthecobacter sp. TaxID=1965333 RepID=UPI003783CDDB
MRDSRFRVFTAAMIWVVTTTSSCVSTKDPVAMRQRSYEKLVAMIQPGMTRRQFYALLPPKEVPRASPPGLFGRLPLNGQPPSDLYVHHREEHVLDRSFQLDVEYKLASHRELRLYEQDMKVRGQQLRDAHAALKRKLKDKHADLLGRGGLWVTVTSRQNMDDEIVKTPQLNGPTGRQKYSTQLVRREEITVTPMDKSKDPEHQLLKVLKHGMFVDEKLSAILNGKTAP